jgi:hypothetical protein
MKKSNLNSRLKLSLQTLRTLTRAELATVAGGGPTGSTGTGCGNRPTLKRVADIGGDEGGEI